MERADLVSDLDGKRHFQLGYRWTEYEENGDGCYIIEPNVMQALAAIGPSERYVCMTTCPPRYRLWPANIGSPPKPEFYEAAGHALANALIETGATYGELWREPNVFTWQISAGTQWYFGAWLDTGDSAYLGGRRYGEALRVVREVIRKEAPGRDVIAGSLIQADLSPGGHNYEWIRGIKEVNNGHVAGAAFSIHYYIKFNSYPNHTEAGLNQAFNSVRAYVQQVKQLVNLPIFITEAAMIQPDECQDTELFRQWQEKFVVFLNQLVRERTIAGYSWYCWAAQWPWWHNSLIRGAQRGDPNLQPTPAYYAWKGNN